MQDLGEAEKREHLRALIAAFETAMLVTRTADGELRSRPLAIAKRGHDGDDDAVYFSTALESGKVDDLAADGHVNLCMQDGLRFASLSGSARVTRERALIDRLWSDDWRVWFPAGKDDPSLCILVVEPREATYWDISGERGLRYAFQSARALVTGTRSPADADERYTAHVELPRR